MKKSDIVAPLVIGFLCGLILPNVVVFKNVFPAGILRFFPLILPVLSLAGVFVLETFFQKTPTLIQFGKSFLVGVLNSSLDMGVFDALTGALNIALGWQANAFKILSFSVGAINSYFWNKFWAFKKTDTEKKGKEAVQFFLVTFGGLFIHSAVIYIMVSVIKSQFGIAERLWASIANMAAVFTGFIWNFAGYKFIVFKK